jgi:RNA polymerase sigma-70 factor (ECF subfamily)
LEPPTEPAATTLDCLAADFESSRPRLFGIAYRMLGSAAEAEDVVQDAWLKWQTTDRSGIHNPAAFLTTMTTRLALNVAGSARVRRQTYLGPWLPEPVFTGTSPELGAENAEALDLGLLMLMERLTPRERAVYLLREAFAYSFGEIAEVLDTSEANARQLGRRARTHLAEHGGTRVNVVAKNRLLHAFLAAAQAGDLTSLTALLTEDIVTYSDGGGIVTAARRPVVGRENVARFLAGILQKVPADVEVLVTSINGADGFLLRRGGEPYLAGTIGVTAAGIDRLFFILNPEKLGGMRALA